MTRLAVIISLAAHLLGSTAGAEGGEGTELRIGAFLTRKAPHMDWWNAVPPRFEPSISEVGHVSRGEAFRVLVVFEQYGIDADGTVDLSYETEVTRPDGTSYASVPAILGFRGEVSAPGLLGAQERLGIRFEPDDPLGEYRVRVVVTDHVTDETAWEEKAVTVQEFAPTSPDDDELWHLNYHHDPDPARAVGGLLQHSRPFLDGEGAVDWPALWFYRAVVRANPFLVPHLVELVDGKTEELQKRNILQLLHLCGQSGALGKLPAKRAAFVSALDEIAVPDPYAAVTSADQLDMLWAEFFATARLAPVRQIVSALSSGDDSGVLERIRSGEQQPADRETRAKVELELVFGAAMWSLGSNCTQIPLVHHYCAGLYEGDSLGPTERRWLGSILSARSTNSAEEPATSPDK